MTNTVGAWAWRAQAVQPVPDPDQIFQETGLLEWRNLFASAAEVSAEYSDETQRGESFSDADQEAAQEQMLGREMLRELPQGYRLRRGMRLDVHRSMDYYWVTASGGFLHGMGDSVAEAIEDYGHGLLEYYFTLQEERESLASHLCRQLEELEDLIVRE